MSSDLEELLSVYGSNFKRQFRQKSSKYQIDLDDVVQEAACVYFEVKDKYDPTKSTQIDFFWGHLNKRLVAFSYGPLRFAQSLDDDSEQGIAFRNEVGVIHTEQTSPTEEIDRETVTPEFAELYAFAESISGQSTTQLAKQHNVTPRRVNQVIQDLCRQAALVHLNRISQNEEKLSIRFPAAWGCQAKIKYRRGIPKSCMESCKRPHAPFDKNPN
jgi:hypothetical protein